MILEGPNSGKSSAQGSVSSIRNSKSQGLPTVKGSGKGAKSDDGLSHDLRHALYVVNTEFKEVKDELESMSVDSQALADSTEKNRSILPELSPRGGGSSFAAGSSSRPSSSTSKRTSSNDDKAQDKMPQISPRPIPSRQASGSVLVPPSESKQTSPRLLEPLQSKSTAAEDKLSPRIQVPQSQSKDEDVKEEVKQDIKIDDCKMEVNTAEDEYEEDGFVSPIKANPMNTTNHHMEGLEEAEPYEADRMEVDQQGDRTGNFDETKQLFDPAFFADDDSVRNDNSVLPQQVDETAQNEAVRGDGDLDEEDYGNENYEDVVKSVLDDIQAPPEQQNEVKNNDGFEPEDDYLDDDYQPPVQPAGPAPAFQPMESEAQQPPGGDGDGDEPSYEADFNTTGMYDDDFDEGGDGPTHGHSGNPEDEPQSKSVSVQNSRYQLLNSDEDYQ